MPTTQTTDFGVVRFMPIATFKNPSRGFDRDARVDKILEGLEKRPGLQSVGDWPRVRLEPIRRGGMFVVDRISDPTFTAMLHFCPARPEVGNYEIHYRPPRERIAKGRTVRLKEVPVDVTDACVSMLTPFQIRYFIVTATDDRARTELVWLVGLKSFRDVEETEIE